MSVGVVNAAPVFNSVPPDDASYHFRFPALATAFNVTVPFPQRDAGVVEVTEGVVLMDAVTAVRADVQPVFVAST